MFKLFVTLHDRGMRKIWSVLLSLLMVACSLPPTSGVKKISSVEVQELMKTKKNYLLLDVRTAQEFAEGHIPGAKNLLNERIQKGEIGELSSKDQLILVYCRSGNRSAQASNKLVSLGYTHVVDMGGINSWKGDIEK